MNEDGVWTSVREPVKTPDEPTGNALNLVTFAPVVAQKFRVLFTHGAAKTGVTEIVYVDSAVQSLPAPPSLGTVTASYTNGGDSADSVNDGIVSFNDFPRNRWTSYGSPAAADWVQTEYERAYSKNTAGIFIYDDGGGVKAPADYDVQYWNGSEWLSAPGQIRTPAQPAGGALNLVSFDTVIASRFRVVFTHAPDARTGVTEIAYVDSNKEPVPVAPPVVIPEPVIAVTAPALGSSVSGTFKIRFSAPDMKNVWARAWHQPDETHADPNGYDAWIANTAPDALGAGEVEIDADLLPHGPLTIVLNAWDAPEGEPAFTKSATSYVQLYNEGGVIWKKGIPAPPQQANGMKVKFEDDFDGPLSVSKTGAGTRYASLKPDWPNGSEFGEAIFADPADAVNPFAVLGDDYLRIRVARAPEGYADPQGWNRKYIGGLLSSVRLDGTGVSAKNGYFEARIQMPAGKGAWPAFWLMSQNSSGADHLPSTAELDIVEAYGHDPAGACQAKHWWSGSPESHQTNCSSENFAYGDNASTWHTYGAKVTEDEVIYYIDDVEVWRHDSFAQANTPLYFMLNLALGGGWPIDLSPYGDQIDMYVDYVRVFEPSEGDAGTPSPEPTASPSSAPTTTPVPTPEAGHGIIKLETRSENGGIIAASVPAPALTAAIGSAKDGKIVLQTHEARSAEGFMLRLPAGPLRSQEAASLRVVELDLGDTRLSIPAEAWGQAADEIVITVKKAPGLAHTKKTTSEVRGSGVHDRHYRGWNRRHVARRGQASDRAALCRRRFGYIGMGGRESRRRRRIASTDREREVRSKGRRRRIRLDADRDVRDRLPGRRLHGFAGSPLGA
ncbi:glycoside hydrolase family 16 protein [Cohnella rhizosphaerae]|uniref:Glycoside hydrolase family 16 protein n=1 Tax=Cohnella rhizosphaerae TaxID=1457232 RepID=A0A9X4QYH8_9BACL|nr:glycoside hydrolase family 16 protein [Cohnella rhizosphaerae]MDG0814707.1 glycoside hydrolase family 16 protein [Cohnella rhizosphaerae]